jgi:hypothetical protein
LISSITLKIKKMKTYLIKRNLPEAGKLTLSDRVDIAKRSCAIIDELGHDNIQWQHSYITNDNIWCIYKAIDQEILKEHARRGNFPCDHILEIHSTFSPATAGVLV